jgi:predicted DNA-binding protein (MmcQ/YjbR family)
MHLDELREYCLQKKGVEECTPFGIDTLVFKLMGKMFLLVGIEADPIEFNVKCSPEKAIELREKYACVQPGYHMNKKHWNSIICDNSVSDKLLKQWIDDSYQLVEASLTKKEKIALAGL